MADASPPPRASLPSVVDWREFLTEYPPGTRATVKGAVIEYSGGNRPKAFTPELQLFCDGACQRVNFCTGVVRTSGLLFPGHDIQLVWDAILYYECRECQTPVKSYGVRLFGENIPYGPQATVD